MWTTSEGRNLRLSSDLHIHAPKCARMPAHTCTHTPHTNMRTYGYTKVSLNQTWGWLGRLSGKGACRQVRTHMVEGENGCLQAVL